MDFIIKRNKKFKKNKRLNDPIEQILDDFDINIIPIHPRLPVMSIDDLIDDNVNILSEYAIKVLKFSKEGKKK
jgi:malate/lactate dehydrogenase